MDVGKVPNLGSGRSRTVSTEVRVVLLVWWMLKHNSINSNSCFLITISMKEVRFALPLIILLLSTLWFSYVGTPYDVRFLNGFGFLSYFFPNINGGHTSSESSSSSLSSSSSSARDSCDYSKGRWVWDETNYPNHSYTENCPFLDPGFRCRLNRRPDESFRQWRWQPEGCDIPRYPFLFIYLSSISHIAPSNI